ncbi:MAG: hypothetical protein ACYCYN_07105 [Solirubrobacteraceae bacterium]
MTSNFTLTRALALALSLASAAALAQSAPAGAGSTGNFPVITVPPPPMSSVANPPTPGADSTLWSNGIPGPQNSSVTIPLPTSPGGGGGPPPVNCTPSSFGQSQPIQCPAGETVGGIAGGQTVFTQSRQIAVTCPAGAGGAPVTTATAWTPPASSECAPPPPGGGPGATCSASCPVSCRVSQTGGNAGKNYTQYWAGGGTAGCPSAGTPTGQNAVDIQGGPPFACSGTQTYTYTSTSSCPVTTGGGSAGGCTVAQVRNGTCPTCSYTCSTTRSGFATCATYGVRATTCSYWGYSGSSCPAGAAGGAWRAGLCP